MIALYALGYLIGVLLIACVIRMELRVDAMLRKQTDFTLYLTPEDILRMCKRDPVAEHFAPRRRTTDHERVIGPGQSSEHERMN